MKSAGVLLCLCVVTLNCGLRRDPLKPTDGGTVETSGPDAAGGIVGTMGSGGKVGSGGMVSSGGMAGSGGMVGSGGMAGPGGMIGSGGMIDTDGGTAPDASLDLPVGPDGPIACTASQKLCGGICVALDDPMYGCAATTCDTSSCPTVDAGATLICQGSACVLGTCGGSTKKCGSQCVALTDPAYGCGATTCDTTGCPNPGTSGTLTCMGTTCVIGTCPSGTKKCANKCVALTDPAFGCGATTCDATLCPAAGSGTLVCQGTTCVIGTCASGTKKCGDKCVPTDANNGCGDPAKCTACATNESCVGSPTTQCQCVPNNTAACMGKACGPATNNCGTAITCPNTCTGVNTCAGGGAGANACGCTANNTAACSGKACGPATNNCGTAITCPDTCATKGQACVSGNTCGCALGASVCGGCLGWDYETGTQFWVPGLPPDLVQFGNGAKSVSTASTPVVAGSKQSLKVNVVLDESLAQRNASVAVALCQTGQTDVSGRTISVNVFFDSAAAFGSLSFLQARAWGATATDSCNLMFGDQMTIGSWHQASCQFSTSGSYDHVAVVILPSPVAWQGTMYLDNVQMN